MAVVKVDQKALWIAVMSVEKLVEMSTERKDD